MQKVPQQNHWVIFGLILLGVVSRLVPHPWNTTPLMAISIFAGTYLSKRWGILLPLITVIASDAILGWHSTMAFSWLAFTLTGMLAWWIRPNPSAGRIFAASIAGSLIFFFVTNFGVWAVGGLYAHTQQGLQACFIAGIPFYRNTLVGDLVFTAVFFGAYALLLRAQATPARADN